MKTLLTLPVEVMVPAALENQINHGWLRVENKEYMMQDGDVAHFRFNV